MDNKGGNLVYRCRMCDEELSGYHVPDLMIAVVALSTGTQTPAQWGATPGITTIHSHKDGYGLADFIGGTADEA